MTKRKTPNEELKRLTEQEFKQSSKNPITIVLDNVRSRQNIGSIFRSADAFLVEQIYLCGISSTPPHRDILKTALGATDTVDWTYFSTTIEAVSQLKAKNYKIVAVEQVDNSISLQDFKCEKNEHIALVFGHEVNGVKQDIVNQSDMQLEIPQFGTKHSFNISVSVGIVLWHIIAQQL